MSSKDTAEALLLVLKKILKWSLVLIIGLIALGILLYGLGNFYDWYSFGRHKDKIEVVAFFDATKCDKEYPLFIGVVNNSSKTLEKVSFYVKVTKKGYSTQLNYNQSYTSDKILAPAEGSGGCVQVVDDHYDWNKRKPLSGQDMEVIVTSFYPTFKENMY
jgi:hypothetical protein